MASKGKGKGDQDGGVKCAAGCGKPATKRCIGCRAVFYCCLDCQRAHWKTGGHKVACKATQARVARLVAATQAASAAAPAVLPPTSVGEEAFSGCSGLQSVQIPETVTAIGKSAFNGCSSLTTVLIPDAVVSIGPEAFQGCTSLREVKLPWSTLVNATAFDGCSPDLVLTRR